MVLAGVLTACPAGNITSAAEPTVAEQTGTIVLDEGSFWRFHVTLRPPVAPAAESTSDDGGPAVLPVKVPYRDYPGIERMETAPPPADWPTPDFDDAAWPRARAGAAWPGSIAVVAFSPATRFSTGLLCLRGKFAVEDPTLVRGLSVSLRYRGGFVLYLNGREVARQDVPDAALTHQTPAKAYPDEAFIDLEGQPIPGSYHSQKRIAAGEEDLTQRLAARNRTLEDLILPAELLRQGTNVLAIELHRSDYHPSALKWFGQRGLSKECGWVPVGLAEVRLTAEGSGIAANVARPDGLRVFNHDLNDRVTVLDYGDPNEPLQPVRIVGARGGEFSAMVVAGSTEPIRGLRVTASELSSDGGRATIRAENVQIRFARLDQIAYQRPPWFDGLTDEPAQEIRVHPASGEAPYRQGGGALQPVLITADVPRDAAAGNYRGKVTISAEGSDSVVVPVELSVAGWTLPEPRQFRTYVGIYQSPVSLALRYGVDVWSQEHWRLMEKSFALLARVGNRIVHVPLSNRTQLGNDEGMVYWLRRPDGSFDYDFSVLDRYLDLVQKHLGIPDFVVLHVWHSGGWASRAAKQQNTVTVVDPAGGRHERMQVPGFGTEESKQFWQPVLTAIRQRLAKRGMEQTMCLGILSDGTAEPEVFAAFDEIVPGGAGWMRACHSVTRETEPYPLKGGGRVVCHEFCYGMTIADPNGELPPVWKQRAWPGVAFIRHNFDHNLSLLKYRTLAERALYCGTRGIGRIGLDFWRVAEDNRGQSHPVFNRWPHSSCAQREPNLYELAAAGPDGPISTVRFEQLREGVEQAEAMIFVAEAVGEHAEKLGPELADRCRQLLGERIRFCLRCCPERYGQHYFRSYHHQWQQLNAELFATAAEVFAALGQNTPPNRNSPSDLSLRPG